MTFSFSNHRGFRELNLPVIFRLQRENMFIKLTLQRGSKTIFGETTFRLRLSKYFIGQLTSICSLNNFPLAVFEQDEIERNRFMAKVNYKTIYIIYSLCSKGSHRISIFIISTAIVSQTPQLMRCNKLDYAMKIDCKFF